MFSKNFGTQEVLAHQDFKTLEGGKKEETKILKHNSQLWNRRTLGYYCVVIEGVLTFALE